MCRSEHSHNAFEKFHTERATLSKVIADSMRLVPGHDLDQLSEQELTSLLDTLQEVRTYLYQLGQLHSYACIYKLIEANDSNQRVFERHLRRLVLKHGKFPSTLFVRGVERIGKNAVTGGGFADIWRGKIDNKIVALKVLRIFDWSADQSKLFKVSLGIFPQPDM